MKRIFKYPISVAILYAGGDSGDMADTQEWVEAMSEALRGLGHVVRAVEVTSRNWRKAVNIPGDVVFNLVEDSEYNLYLKVARRLEETGRGQVGVGHAGMKFVVKKARVKRRLMQMGIPTPDFRIFNRRSDVSGIKRINFPLIVKPSGQHAGIGINQDSVVIDKKELDERVSYIFKHYPGEVVAEEYIEGREIHVTVLGNGKHLVALPAAEIVFGGEFADNWNVYTYEAKWEKESWEYWAARVNCPAMVRPELGKRLEKAALDTFRALGCRDVARFDIRVDDKEKLFVVDVNMCPSLNALDSEDATVRSALVLGWDYAELLENVIAINYRRIYGSLPDRIRERQFLLASPQK